MVRVQRDAALILTACTFQGLITEQPNASHITKPFGRSAVFYSMLHHISKRQHVVTANVYLQLVCFLFGMVRLRWTLRPISSAATSTLCSIPQPAHTQHYFALSCITLISLPSLLVPRSLLCHEPFTTYSHPMTTLTQSPPTPCRLALDGSESYSSVLV